MEYKRLTSDTALTDLIKSIEKRAKSAETKWTGTMSFVDEATGVETIIGQLPDGTTGIQPFVGDTTPPPVATAPSVTAEPGIFIITWDGLFAGAAPKPHDFIRCNIIGHKIEGGSTVLSIAVGQITTSLDFTHITTDIAAVGETWQFSLESEDYNGNRAAISTKSAIVTMIGISTDQAVIDALADLQSEIDANEAAALAAQQDADTAFSEAVAAAEAAGFAQQTADLKNRVWYLDAAPAGTAHKQDDIWFETDNENKPYRWNATTNQWVAAPLGNAAIANLDAGKITAGFLAAARIAVKSIEADRLVITSTDNLAVEANFSNAGFSWELSANKTINATAGRGSLPAFRVTGTTANQTSLNKNNKFTVGYEDRFRGTIIVKSSAALASGAVQLLLKCYTTATAFTTITVATASALTAGAWMQISGISPVLPAGTISCEIVLSVTNNATGTITDIDYVSLTRAASGNLIVDGDITTIKLAADSVTAEKVAAKAITVDKLAVGMGTNLVSDPGFNDISATGWPVAGTFHSYDAAPAGRNGGKALRLPTDVATNVVYASYNTVEKRIPLVPNAPYYVSVWVKSSISIPINTTLLYLVCFDSANATTHSTPLTSSSNQTVIPANTWTKISSMKQASATAATGSIGIGRLGSFAAELIFSEPYVERAMDGELIVDGAVKANKLDANEIWADTSWLGTASASDLTLVNTDSPTFTSTVSGQGISVTYTDPETGEIEPRVSVGTFTEDYISISDDDGKPSIVLEKDGTISGRSLSIENTLFYKGEELQTYLSPFAQGVMVSAFGTPALVTNITNVWLRVISAKFVAAPGRNYKAVFQGLQVYSNVANDRVSVKMSYALDAFPTATTPPTDMSMTALPVANGATTTPMLQAMGTFNNTGIDAEVTLCVYIRRETGSGTLNYNTYGGNNDFQKPLRLWVEDMGPDVTDTGTIHAESGTAPPATPAAPTKITRTSEWAATSVRSYKGDNTLYSFNIGKAYQGLSPAGFGNLKSMYGFPSLTSTIGTAAVHDIWAYFYFEHWFYNAGGAAKITVHGHSTLPEAGTAYLTLDPSGNTPSLAITSSSWPKAAGRWVRIPSSLYQGFKDGIYRGVGLAGDGTYNTYGIANASRIRIKYTK